MIEHFRTISTQLPDRRRSSARVALFWHWQPAPRPSSRVRPDTCWGKQLPTNARRNERAEREILAIVAYSTETLASLILKQLEKAYSLQKRTPHQLRSTFRLFGGNVLEVNI